MGNGMKKLCAMELHSRVFSSSIQRKKISVSLALMSS